MDHFILAAALFLTAYNLRSDAAAGDAAGAAFERLNADISENARLDLPPLPSGESLEEAYIPDYLLNPGRAMPSEEIDGQSYISVLRIPALSHELPVIGEWSYPQLNIAPCRYTGLVYLDNMVIAAHNYFTHFGYLKNLSPGDEITFTNPDVNLSAIRSQSWKRSPPTPWRK